MQDELKQYFRPELLNRLDEIIIFRPLSRDEIAQIAELQVRALSDRLRLEQGLRLEVSESLRELLVSQGYNPREGARALRRAPRSPPHRSPRGSAARRRVAGSGDRARRGQ